LGAATTWRTPATDADGRRNFRGDDLRRLAKPPRQLEGDRRAQIAEVAVRRRLQDEGRLRRNVEAVEL
jgi:hypothetical protein